jgi:hypothetical protein
MHCDRNLYATSRISYSEPMEGTPLSNSVTARKSGRKRKAVTYAVVWLIVSLTVFLGAVAALIMEEPEPAQTGPFVVDRQAIHWSFDTKGNYTDSEVWKSEFDDLLPGEYTVFPEFYNWEGWEMGGSVGVFEIRTYMYLNDVYHYGQIHDIEMAGPGGSSSHEWIGGERVLEYFSNATLKASGNVLEVRFSISSNMSTYGDGWMDIAAGPLLLYAKRLSSPMNLFVVPIVSAILALPSAYAIVVVSRRLRENQS